MLKQTVCGGTQVGLCFEAQFAEKKELFWTLFSTKSLPKWQLSRRATNWARFAQPPVDKLARVEKSGRSGRREFPQLDGICTTD